MQLYNAILIGPLEALVIQPKHQELARTPSLVSACANRSLCHEQHLWLLYEQFCSSLERHMGFFRAISVGFG